MIFNNNVYEVHSLQIHTICLRFIIVTKTETKTTTRDNTQTENVKKNGDLHFGLMVRKRNRMIYVAKANNNNTSEHIMLCWRNTRK